MRQADIEHEGYWMSQSSRSATNMQHAVADLHAADPATGQNLGRERYGNTEYDQTADAPNSFSIRPLDWMRQLTT